MCALGHLPPQGEGLWQNFLRLDIAFFLGKDAAAVFLHIEAVLPGESLPLFKVGTEVPIQELHAVLRRRRRREESDSVREYETGRWEMMGEMGAQGAFDD